MPYTSTKDRGRTDVRQIVAQDDDNQRSPGGGRFIWRQAVPGVFKPSKRQEVNRAFFLSFFLSSIFPPKDFKLFTWSIMWIIMLMEFKLEVRVTEKRMQHTFLSVDCKWA